jgi:beta-phosphoglucomutase-like phosphatase (HAD superfamily)
MTRPRPVRAVILDMDGTLHDTEIIYHTALKRAVAACGATITDAFCQSHRNTSARESVKLANIPATAPAATARTG